MKCQRIRLWLLAFTMASVLGLVATGSSQTKKETKQWQKCEQQINAATEIQQKIAFYEKFVKDNPKNYYVKDAQAKIAELREERDFKIAESQNTLEAYRMFLSNHPQGSHLEEVKTQLLAFNLLPDEVDWIVAQARQTAIACEEFVKKHPDSRFAREAHQKIAEIRNCTLVLDYAAGAKVYIGPDDLGSANNPLYDFYTPELIIGDQYFKGETPLTIKLEPGAYQVAILTIEIPESAQDEYCPAPKPGFQRGAAITPVAGCMQISRTSEEEILLIVRNQRIIRGGKLYKINLAPNAEKKLAVKDLFRFD